MAIITVLPHGSDLPHQWMQDAVGVTWNKCSRVSTDHHVCWREGSISYCVWISALLARIFGLAQTSYLFYLLCWIEISFKVIEGSTISCFSQPDTVDTLDWILLCCRAVSCNVGCFAASSPSSHCMPVASLPPQLWQPQNFQTLSNVPWGATSPTLRTTEQKGAFRGIAKMLKS